ncbi:MAG: hypothetical protein HY331_02630 [Chloroflexi bacterium]|nr:hypothetical protein [Chloroflexota bacterium]
MTESWQQPEIRREAGEEAARTQKAEQLRRRFDWLSRFTDEELRDISFCAEGVPLQTSAEYLDISHPERGVIVARAGEQAPAGGCYVARTDVSPEVWRKLISAARQG